MLLELVELTSLHRISSPMAELFLVCFHTHNNLVCEKAAPVAWKKKSDNSCLIGFFTAQALATGEEADSTHSSAKFRN